MENGQKNIGKLGQIREEHDKQRLRLASELELLETECEALKAQFKNVQKRE